MFDNPLSIGLGEGGNHIHIKRLAQGAMLLGAVEDGDGFDGVRQRGGEMGEGERPVQAYLNEPDLFAAFVHFVDGFVDGFAGRAQGDDHALRIRRSAIIEQVVLAPGQFGEAVHLRLHGIGASRVERIARFLGLEKRVRVLRRAAQDRIVRGQRPLPMAGDQFRAQHFAQIIVAQFRQAIDLVRGTEPVEEMDERDASGQGRGLAKQRHVLRFLGRAGAQHGHACLPAGHDVALIAEDGKGVGGDRARRDMHTERSELAGDLVQIWDHQQQALGGREGGRQSAGLQRAMDGADGAGLRLHFDNVRDLAPNVLALLEGIFLGQFAHHRGRGDRVDGNDFVGPVGNRGDRFGAVDGDNALLGHARSSCVCLRVIGAFKFTIFTYQRLQFLNAVPQEADTVKLSRGRASGGREQGSRRFGAAPPWTMRQDPWRRSVFVERNWNMREIYV